MAPGSLRVSIQQPSLPKYRGPVFRRLSEVEGRQLVLYYGSEEPSLRNVEPVGFEGRFVPFTTWRIGSSQIFFWHSAQWSMIDRKVTDVAIMCWNARFLSLLPALVKARLLGIPVALWGHGYSKRTSRLRSFLRNIPARLANAVILYDFKAAEQLAQAGFPARKLFVAPNGLDTSEIERVRTRTAAAPSGLAEFGASHGLTPGPVLVYIGRIFRENRLDLAIGALAILARSRPTVRLVVIGKGQAEEDELRSLASRLGVERLVTWVGALYSEEALAPWLMSADVFVYPSNVGLSIIHAFNYAIPAVVCPPLHEHNPEVGALQDTVNGCVARDKSAEAIAEAIEFIVADPERHRRMRAAAAETAKTTYNIGHVVQSFDRLIGLLGMSRGTP